MDMLTSILNQFGIETKLFVAQIVNFAILLIILKLLLYKPIAQMLEERKNKIKQGLDDAKNAKEALAVADTQKVAILKNARIDADKILEVTKVSAQNLKNQAAEQAKQEASEIVENARKAAQEELAKSQKQVAYMSIDASKQIVSKILSDIFTEEEKTKILSRAIDKIEHSGYEKTIN